MTRKSGFDLYKVYLQTLKITTIAKKNPVDTWAVSYRKYQKQIPSYFEIRISPPN